MTAARSFFFKHVLLGPGGPRNFMKITQSRARMQMAWSGEVDRALEESKP